MKKKIVAFVFLLLSIDAYSQTQKEWGKIYKSCLQSFLKKGYYNILLANTTVNSELNKLDSILLEQLSVRAGFSPDASWRSFFKTVETKTKSVKEERLPDMLKYMVHQTSISTTSPIFKPYNEEDSVKFNRTYPGLTTLIKISNIILSDDLSKGIVQINIWYKNSNTGEGYCVFLEPKRRNVWKKIAEALIWKSEF